MTQIGKTILFWIFLLSSCSPSSLVDLRYEGEAEVRKIAKELHAIETTEDLQKAIPRLKQRFNRLAKILVETRQFPKAEEMEVSCASEELFAELARIYEMPSGRELVERAQLDAIKLLR